MCLKRMEFRKGDKEFKYTLEFSEYFWIDHLTNWYPKDYCRYHATARSHHCRYISWTTAVCASHSWKWRMELPRPKEQDEDNTWSQEDEDNFNFCFGPLLETIHWKMLSGENDEEYYCDGPGI
jgi:hypothetical protein